MLFRLPGVFSKTHDLRTVTVGMKANHEVSDEIFFCDYGFVFAIEGKILNLDDIVPHFTKGSKEFKLSMFEAIKKFGFEGLVKKLRGDFVIFLYDSASDIVWLARDRVGVKPLYYREDKDGFTFSSQPRALLLNKSHDPKINLRFAARFAAGHYRCIDNLPSESPYEGISQLPPATILRYCISTQDIKKSEYWSLAELPDLKEPEDELAENYKELLLDSVNIRIKGRQNKAFLLSGGMDSSTILCCAKRLTGQRQTAFSSVYDDPTYDESNEIKDVVQSDVSNWNKVTLPNEIDIFHHISEMIEIHEEPVATATWLSHYLLLKNVKCKGFEHLFGGLGGDELNAGEFEYFPMHFADLKANGKLEQYETEVAAWVKHHDHPVHRKSKIIADRVTEQLIDTNNPGVVLPDYTRLRQYADAVDLSIFNLHTFEPDMSSPFTTYLKSRTYHDLTRETLPCCLRAEDRHSTALGITHVDPFLDHKLIEFMYQIPGELKIKNGVTKQLLRRAVTDIVPTETRQRIKKTGWNAPAHKWFSKKSLGQLQDYLNSQWLKEMNFFNINYVEKIAHEHLKAQEENDVSSSNHMMFLWQISNCIVWFEKLNQFKK